MPHDPLAFEGGGAEGGRPAFAAMELHLVIALGPDHVASGQTGPHPQTSAATVGAGIQPQRRPLWPEVVLKAARAAGLSLGCLGRGVTRRHWCRASRRHTVESGTARPKRFS